MATSPSNPDPIIVCQVSSTTLTPPYEDGLYGNGVGPRSWVSVYGEPGTTMMASLTSKDCGIIEAQGQSTYVFTISSNRREEFQVFYQPTHRSALVERLAVQCTVQGTENPGYGGSTTLIFGRYFVGNGPIVEYGYSTGAPSNPRSLGLNACCSIYVMVTPPEKQSYKNVAVQFDVDEAFIPNRPDGIVPLTTLNGNNQYAIVNVRYDKGDRRTVNATISVPDDPSNSTVTTRLAFQVFPLASSARGGS